MVDENDIEFWKPKPKKKRRRSYGHVQYVQAWAVPNWTGTGTPTGPFTWRLSGTSTTA